ncbi:MAG: hypothetical protein M3N16_07075 [Actinomycetota bacterium]|nr:hypothetical protein [Actinomycetota bacterium]
MPAEHADGGAYAPTTRKQLLAAGGAALAGAAASAGLGADRADAAGRGRGRGRGIVGSWSLTVTATDPAGLEPFRGLITFHADGTVTEARRLYVPETPFGPLLETPGHGGWRSGSKNRFHVAFAFLIQGAPDNPGLRGRFLGTDHVRWTPTLRRGELAGPFESQVRDPDDRPVFTARGTVVARRLPAPRR